MKNEYLDKYIEIMGYPTEENPWAWEGWPGPGQLMDSVRARHEMVLDYAWAIPTDDALDALVKLSPIVEIGAGGGYWAALLRARGADVIAYDDAPNGNRNVRKLWGGVAHGNTASARKHPDRTLFLCWPPYATPMAFSALYGYLECGGHTLAYVGESDGGCTGNAEFFDLIEERMTETTVIALPQWAGIHDRLYIYTRKE